MRILMSGIVLGVLGCAGGEPGLADRLAGAEAELDMKNEKISLLEIVVDRQHELLEGFKRNENPPGALDLGVASDARDRLIRDLRRQLDYATSALVKLEAASRESLEGQRREYEGKMGALKERLAGLEKQLSERN